MLNIHLINAIHWKILEVWPQTLWIFWTSTSRKLCVLHIFRPLHLCANNAYETTSICETMGCSYCLQGRIKRSLLFIERQREEEAKRKKDKLPPKAPKDRPIIFDITQNSLKLSWQPSEIPAYGEQTPIFYIVERRYGSQHVNLILKRNVG